MEKEIRIVYPDKILPWIGAPFMAAWISEGIILLIGFTTDLLFVNYFFEVLFLFLFCLSCRKKYECYKIEPDLKITKYFWIETGIHILFISVAAVQSYLNVRLEISNTVLNYSHDFPLISIAISALHFIYVTIDYYATEKAAIVRYCRKMKNKTV